MPPQPQPQLSSATQLILDAEDFAGVKPSPAASAFIRPSSDILLLCPLRRTSVQLCSSWEDRILVHFMICYG